MKLYFKPGACSLATHIVLRELGIDFTLEPVDTQTQRTESGIDYKTVNPKGYVPALDTGRAVLTEGAAILQYLAESTTLIPDVGTLERARLQEHLNYIASELHKAFGPSSKPAQRTNSVPRHWRPSPAISTTWSLCSTMVESIWWATPSPLLTPTFL